MRNLRASGAAFVVVLLGPSWVLAGGGQLRFDWRAPDVCPTRERVLARAEELLGRPPESGLTSVFDLSALVAQTSQGSWQLELRSRTESGQTTARSVTAASCTELADAAALLLALAIDPALSERASPTSSAFEAEPQPAVDASASAPAPAQPPQSLPAPRALEPAAPTASPAAPAERDAPSAPVRLRAGAAFAVWGQRLPGVAPGALAHAGISRRAGWAVATFGAFPARHASVAGAAAGGDLSLFSFGAEVGYTIALAPKGFEVSPLVGGELDWVRGAGTGVAHPGDGSLLLVGLSGGGRAALPLSASWAIFGQGLFSALVARPRFVLDGVGELYRPPAWGLRFSLGAEWRQP